MQTMNAAKMIISFFGRVKNIVGKGKNPGYQHFSFSNNVFFKEHLSKGCLKVGFCVTELKEALNLG